MKEVRDLAERTRKWKPSGNTIPRILRMLSNEEHKIDVIYKPVGRQPPRAYYGVGIGDPDMFLAKKLSRK